MKPIHSSFHSKFKKIVNKYFCFHTVIILKVIVLKLNDKIEIKYDYFYEFLIESYTKHDKLISQPILFSLVVVHL